MSMISRRSFSRPANPACLPAMHPAAIIYESLYGNTGRNTFRAPFQVRFDMTMGKKFQISERFRLRFNFDAFNLFNHPDFDAPNNDVHSSPNSRAAVVPAGGSLGIIQHTIGSSRFLQLSLHLQF